MVDRVVIDASVAVACLVSEEKTGAARRALAVWSNAGAELLVPSHFWIEVQNVLVRRPARSAEEVVAALVVLDKLAPRTVELDRPTLLLALDGMTKFRLSAYDAIYLALAQATDARLATLDRRLAQAAGDHGQLIGASEPRLAETRAPYLPDAALGWGHSATVGGYIAELRYKTIAGIS